MKSIKKMIDKRKHQEKVNPGNASKYEQPMRPRSTIYKSKKDYNRSNNKKAIKEAYDET